MLVAEGTVVAGKYQLEKQLARGGMGSVWIARHVKLGSQLAIKFLDPRLASSPSFVARFEREARAAAAIQSPHVVHVQDFGVDDGTPYIAMELLRGEDLRARLRREGRMSLASAAHLLLQLGKGLRRAHEAGIVHRDIKPGNLFLARHDDDDILKILDFGIAKEGAVPIGEGTKTGEIIGSPHYVSPEQARADKDVDLRSDVWSVGVIAYRMVTGSLPFPGDSLGRVMSKVLVDPPPPVRAVVPGLPLSLDVFFARALAKEREKRFQTVRELVDAFVVLARLESLDENVPPPSWSSIVSVSKAPPPPDPPRLPGAVAQAAGGVAAAAGQAPPPSSPAPGAVRSFGPPSAPGANVVSTAPSAPPPPWLSPSEPFHGTGLDSLTPATGPGIPNFRPQFPLQKALIIGASVLVGAGGSLLVSSYMAETSPSALPSGPPSVSAGGGSPGPVLPTATLPTGAVPSPPATGLKTAAPLSSSASPPRSASAAAPRPPPSPSGAVPKRKWGF